MVYVLCCAKLLQSCPTLCYPMDRNLSGSSVYRILQPIILEWVVVPSSRGSSQPRISPTHISYVFLLWLAELMPPGKPSKRCISSVQFSRSVVSNSLQPHESQHARPPCPSPTPGVYSNPCPLSRWCHPAISSSVIPFSSCPQSLPASGSFQWVNSLHEVAKVLEFQLQHQSFQWIPRTDSNEYSFGLVGSPYSPRDSQESSPIP